MISTISRHSLDSSGIWRRENSAPAPVSSLKGHTPNQVPFTKSLIRMKLLTWFAEFTPISRRRTQEAINTALRWHNAQLSSRNHAMEARLVRLENKILHEWEREPTETD